MMMDGPKGFRVTLRPHLILPSAYTVAPVLFALWVAAWRVRWGVLAWLGRVSYSFYLFHLIVAVPLLAWVALDAERRLARLAAGRVHGRSRLALTVIGQRGGVLRGGTPGHRAGQTAGGTRCNPDGHARQNQASPRARARSPSAPAGKSSGRSLALGTDRPVRAARFAVAAGGGGRGGAVRPSAVHAADGFSLGRGSVQRRRTGHRCFTNGVPGTSCRPIFSSRRGCPRTNGFSNTTGSTGSR